MIITEKLTETSAGPLTPRTGTWNRWHASHLLRRTTYAPLPTEVDEAIALGMEASVDRLLETIPDLPPPVYVDYGEHPEADIGDSWVDLYFYDDGNGINLDRNARVRSIFDWTVRAADSTGFNIREKMVMFWNNHFGMGGFGLPKLRYRYYSLYREFATGNFRELVKRMAVDPYMLRFLNGYENTAANPNENFAREILELFTIGRGPEVGVGDYTNYTEQDVTELARVFTGWRIRYINSTVPDQGPEVYFVPNRHDTGTKTLSARFDNAVIENAGDQEYANAIDVIFTKDEVARFICRKLYRHFVFYDITPWIDRTVIQPLADILIANDYNIKPALRALLTSRHFYWGTFVGAQIKTPLEYAMTLTRPTGFLDQGSVYDNYRAANQVYRHCRDTGMDLLSPPNVAGWPAYYQAPSFHELWLNSSTLQERNRFAQRATSRGFYWDGDRYDVNWLPVVNAFNDPFEAREVVREMAKLLLSRGLKAEQTDYLLDLLLDGQVEQVWTSEYANYISNQLDDALVMAINMRLRAMVFGFTELAEFQAQ